jgi:hypothetical protein
MKSRLLILALALAGSGCAVGIGQTCNPSTACPSDLVCSYPRGADGGTLANGVCDYALKPEGMPCTVAAECDTTLTCSNHFTPNNRYGTCAPKLPSGGACFQNRDCQSNRCDGADGTTLSGICR